MKILVKLKNKEAVCLVDDDVAELIAGYSWRMNDRNYVRTSKYMGMKDGKEIKKEVQIHRLIMDAPVNLEVDHINGNPLDNRRSNLRLCNRNQNKANTRIVSTNTSGYKGVSKHKGKWQASIRINNKLCYLGRFLTKERAALEYNKRALQEWGEFAWLNPIPRAKDMAGA